MAIYPKSDLVEQIRRRWEKVLADLEEQINSVLKIGYMEGKSVEIDLLDDLNPQVKNEILQRCRAAGYIAYINYCYRDPAGSCFSLVIK